MGKRTRSAQSGRVLFMRRHTPYRAARSWGVNKGSGHPSSQPACRWAPACAWQTGIGRFRAASDQQCRSVRHRQPVAALAFIHRHDFGDQQVDEQEGEQIAARTNGEQRAISPTARQRKGCELDQPN